MHPGGAHLRAISPDATPEEVAAVLAAVGSLALGAPADAVEVPERLDDWVSASRLTARGVGLHRGPWRLSGRVGRRTRA